MEPPLRTFGSGHKHRHAHKLSTSSHFHGSSLKINSVSVLSENSLNFACHYSSRSLTSSSCFFSSQISYFQPHSWQAFDLVPSYSPPPLSLSLSSRPGVCCPDRNEAFAVCGPTVHVPEEGEEIESRNVGGLTGRK